MSRVTFWWADGYGRCGPIGWIELGFIWDTWKKGEITR